MRIKAKDHIRKKNFPVRISRNEENFLKSEAIRQSKTMTELIREGYLKRMGRIKNSHSRKLGGPF